ncbi:RidA family protein [Saccharopolyspora sp. CA-218241]|uniref:RidA family protein n=1 Tax=Saccharopolyspora sp. CA-218241 TaxID=3240027 RepID=UPI003D99157C
MAVSTVHPAGLPEIDIYRHVSIATGTKLVSIAGQVSWDADEVVVGAGDLAAQVERCYRNVGTALAAVGGTFDDVVRLSLYVVDWHPDKMPVLLAGIARAKEALGTTAVPPLTMLGVAALDVPEHLVEVQATAMLD